MKCILQKSIGILAIGTTLTSGKQPEVKADRRPNIIFIMSDDHAYQALSAYGHPISKLAPTPNIDQIANEGMRFDRCLVTNSISGPSRACILTGKYSHKNGYISNEVDGFDGSQQTFPKLLQKAGYLTSIIGKWHLGTTPTGFNHWEVLDGQGHYYNPDFITSKGVKCDSGYVTELITQKTLKWLDAAKSSGKPFMLMLHHKAPHRPWQPGPNELALYKDTQFPEPSNLFDDYSGRGTAAKEQELTIAKILDPAEDFKLATNAQSSLIRMSKAQKKVWDSYYDPIIEKFKQTKPSGKDMLRWKYQRYIQDYTACIAGVDKSVGEVLKYLKDNGLDKNTIIVYTSDQGFYLGEHGWFDKRFMYEESYRTPLLIKWPDVIKPKSVNTDIVSNIDFAETFLSAAGVKVPSDMQGENMIPLLKGTSPKSWRQSHYYHFYEYPGIGNVKCHYGISTKQYKLIHFYYDIDEWELYDLKADPKEMKNVYNDPKYTTVKANLHKQLKKLMFKYGDSDSLSQTFITKFSKYKK